MDDDGVLQDEVDALMAIFSPSDFILAATEPANTTGTTSTRPPSTARDVDDVVVIMGIGTGGGDGIDRSRRADDDTVSADSAAAAEGDEHDGGGGRGGGDANESGAIHSSTGVPALLRLRLVGGAANTGPFLFDLWLNVQRLHGYPSVPAVVNVVCDPAGCVVADRLVELAAVGTRVASELARSGQVAVFDVFTAVRDELAGIIGLTASASANASMHNDGIDSHPFGAEAAGDTAVPLDAHEPPRSPPCLQSSDQLGVTLRFLLGFAARHGIGGFCKWETAGVSPLGRFCV